MRILGIHGISQQFESGPELTQPWWLAVRGGLEAAGFRETADNLSLADIRVVFFGDLFRPDGAMAVGGPLFTSADITSGPERELLEKWYMAAVKLDPSLGPPDGALGPGRVAVQVMLERLMRSRIFAGVAQRAFIGDLKQVTAFLNNTDIKEHVLERVSREIASDTKVLIGHSLGSVVAYEYLTRFAPPQVELLVTVGSPLGIPNVIFDRLTPAPVRGFGAWPGSVARWVNIADEDDFVALRKQLSPLFPPPAGTPGVEDHIIVNGKEPHGIRQHLNAKPTGQAVASAL